MNRYQTLLNSIQTPTSLEQRVLDAAKQKQYHRNWKPAFRAAVCAALALALTLSSWTMSIRQTADNSVQDSEAVTNSAPVTGLFTLSAYAADLETVVPAAPDGILVIGRGVGESSPDGGNYTGCLFQINGEDIASVSLSLDRGKLYHFQVRKNLTEEEVTRTIQEEKQGIAHDIGMDEDGNWYAMDMTLLGSNVTETYNPAVQYGFWTPALEQSEDTDLAQAFRNEIDQLDGAHLTVTVRSTADAEQTQIYELSTGKLKTVDTIEGMPMQVLAEWAEEGENFTYGVMLTPIA